MKLKEKIESLEQQLTALQSQIAALKEAEKEEEIKPWVPEMNEMYYYVHACGNARIMEYIGYPVDFELTKNLNAYKTEEEAEFWAERFKVFRELSLFSVEQVTGDLRHDDLHEIHISMLYNSVSVQQWDRVAYAPILFESVEMAQKAIDYVGEERLKKYWFRVESNGD